MPLFVHRLTLSHFRSYPALRLELKAPASGAHIVVLTGKNGVGKTNILEAISLLTPGRGLRGADMLEMKSRSAEAFDVWGIAADVTGIKGVAVKLGTGLDREAKRRVIRIDGATVKSQNHLADILAAVWLTPQMDRLFLDGASARRKFLDRLVYAYDAAHVTRLNRYDKNLRERMKVLQLERGRDPAWLTSLESQLAADGVAIAAARLDLIDQLAKHSTRLVKLTPLFPKASLSLSGFVETSLLTHPASAVEALLQEKLAAARALDAAAGRSSEGIHRSDLLVTYADKDMPAASCSTGEQKALLVSIILSHALMMQAEKGFVPLILLDEVAAHLDEARRLQLFTLLQSFKGQIWLTGTDVDIFAPLQGQAEFFAVEDLQ
jgi:DNA replication and repair protein RecF